MIAVPSKGRAGKSATLAALRESRDVLAVVPLDEIGAYREAYPNVVTLSPPEPGIGPARQAALEYARSRKTGPFWMLDDDITRVYERNAMGMMVKTSLLAALDHLDADIEGWGNGPGFMYGWMLAGPNFRHRAWAAPSRLEMDVHLRNFVKVRPSSQINYWPHLKEDLDLVLQILSIGHHTIRFNHISFDSPVMGTSQGGCREDYDAGKLDDACRALVAKWPSVVELRLDDKTGHLTNRVNWKKARERVPA